MPEVMARMTSYRIWTFLRVLLLLKQLQLLLDRMVQDYEFRPRSEGSGNGKEPKEMPESTVKPKNLKL